VVIHIFSATRFTLAKAFPFTPALHRARWHRWAGRSVVPMGIAVALSGFWMTLTCPCANVDGWATDAARLMFGTGMALALILGVTPALKRDSPPRKPGCGAPGPSDWARARRSSPTCHGF
jgi:Predicted membrane protein (DUF2306)